MSNSDSDQKARTAALDISRSFIVQAPAGSGKTSLLIDRYLTLLAFACQNPEEVLALTFTRKAAAEMRTRIINALISAKFEQPGDTYKKRIWQLANAVLKKSKDLNWNLLENPNRLKIYTIDGFCNSLVKQTPITSELGSKLTIVQDIELNEIYHEAARSLLAMLEDNEPYAIALEQLLLHLDNDQQKVQKLLVTMLAKRDQWLPHIYHENLTDLRTKMENALANIVQETLAACKNCLSASLANEIKETLNFDLSESDDIRLWLCFSEKVLTKDGKWRKRIQDKFSNLCSHEQFRYHLYTLSLYHIANFSQDQWQITEALLLLLKALAANLRLIFQSRQLVDYIEIAQGAIQSLGDLTVPSDLAFKLDYFLNHILVDEFQDTSTTQFKLLEKLTFEWRPNDGRTLFIVGDPMQSIYRFREAKVGLFLRAKHFGIGNIKLEFLNLTSNFRSQPLLVSWVNKTFLNLFPESENIGLGAIPFISANSAQNAGNSVVSAYLFRAEDYTHEAEQVVKIIYNEQVLNPKNNIAILVRYRSHLSEIISCLTKANIAFKAVELEHLSASMVVQDLFSLTRALLDPNDKVAWLAVLRAPWCGLKLSDLLLLSQNQELPLLSTLKNFTQVVDLSPDAIQRLNSVIPILVQALEQRRRLPLRQWVEKTWNQLNGAKIIDIKKEQINVTRFFDLLNEAEQAADIVKVKLLEQKLESSFSEAVADANAKVQIMTIHKAKGLEFDTVIIPGLDRKPRNEEAEILKWTERASNRIEEDADLILAPIKSAKSACDPIYDYLKFEDEQKSYFETGRLLYVAATRAKQNLYLLATTKKQPQKGSLLAQLHPHLSNSEIIISEPNKQHDESKPKSVIRRLPLNVFKTTKQQIEEKVESNNYFEWQQNDNTAANIGTVVHNSLAKLSTISAKEWSSYLAEQPNIWKNQLLQLGTIDNLEEHVAKISRALTNTINDERGRWLLDNSHQDAKSEYGISRSSYDCVEHFIIDRTFVENNIRWIIDYKTSDLKQNESIQQFLVNEKKLYQQQLTNYAEALHALNGEKIYLGLYFPMLSRWLQWEHIK